LWKQHFDYIEEHLMCTTPMAEALDIMQGELNTYYGVVPYLLVLKRKIEILAKPECIWIYCKPIADALLQCIQKRFENYLNFTSLESLNAALSYPRFKKCWLTCVKTKNHDRLIHIFKKAADEVISIQNIPLDLVQSPVNQTTNNFFDFRSSYSTLTGIPKSELEVLYFSADEENDLNNLDKYPITKQVVIRYNTPLPLSAPVE